MPPLDGRSQPSPAATSSGFSRCVGIPTAITEQNSVSVTPPDDPMENTTEVDNKIASQMRALETNSTVPHTATGRANENEGETPLDSDGEESLNINDQPEENDDEESQESSEEEQAEDINLEEQITHEHRSDTRRHQPGTFYILHLMRSILVQNLHMQGGSRNNCFSF